MKNLANSETLKTNPEIARVDLPEWRKLQEESKTMQISEFRKLGYLQELNRLFLHPLGLSLFVIVEDETGNEIIGGIKDYREEGIIFDPELEKTEEFLKRKYFIENEFNIRSKV